MTEEGKSGEMSTSFQCSFNTALHARESPSLKQGEQQLSFRDADFS